MRYIGIVIAAAAAATGTTRTGLIGSVAAAATAGIERTACFTKLSGGCVLACAAGKTSECTAIAAIRTACTRDARKGA